MSTFVSKVQRLSGVGWPVAAAIVALVVALPVLVVLSSVFVDSGGAWTHLADTLLGTYVRNTILLATSVGVLSLLIGVGTGWLVTMCRFPGREIFRWALLLPLAVPAYLSAYAYTDLLQFSGPVQSTLRSWFDLAPGSYWFPAVRSMPGAIIVLTLAFYPYVYLAARTAFIEQSACALEVSRTLGRGPWSTFFRVALPLARPSIAAGTALVLMETVAEFGAVDYFAVDTFSTGIYRTWLGLESPTAAAQLSACLLGVVGLLVLLEIVGRRRAQFHQTTHRSRNLARYRLGPRKAWAAAACCLVPVIFGFAIPLGRFMAMSWQHGDARSFELFVDHGRNSVVLASVASVLAAFLAIIVVFGHRIRGSWMTRIALRFAGSGYAIPGAVIAIGLVIPLTWIDHRINDVTRSLFDYTPGLVLTGSIVAVVLGYQTRFLAVALAVLESSFGRVRRSLDDAARTLGARGHRLLFRVHLPLIKSSLLAAVLLVFVDVIKELPATLILRPFNFETLAVRVYQLASDERLHEASTGALAIILIGLVPVYVLSTLLDRSRAGGGIA